jgi:hypothetical protein
MRLHTSHLVSQVKLGVLQQLGQVEEFKRSGGTWIMKSIERAQGQCIFLFKKLSQVRLGVLQQLGLCDTKHCCAALQHQRYNKLLVDHTCLHVRYLTLRVVGTRYAGTTARSARSCTALSPCLYQCCFCHSCCHLPTTCCWRQNTTSSVSATRF